MVYHSIERVFTVSIRKDLNKDFKFPEKEELKIHLQDVLEEKVDEKYFLSDKYIKYCTNENTGGYNRKKIFESNIDLKVAKCITTKSGSRPCDNYVNQ